MGRSIGLEKRTATKLDADACRHLLLEGRKPEEVAAELGCSIAAVKRYLAADPIVARANKAVRKQSEDKSFSRYDDLSSAVIDAIHKEVEDKNVRVLIWLADRLDLLKPEGEKTPADEFTQLLDSLTSDELGELRALGRNAPKGG
ncbi:MAG: hypothetical protein ACFB6S_02160 [Geminicoccaceae bacterium]